MIFTFDIFLIIIIKYHIINLNLYVYSGCDLNAPRRPGPDGIGGDEARDECTPLHLCCQWGLEQVIQTLIEHDADVNARDVEGKTPIHVAIQNQHSQIISLLLYHPNIDLNIRDKKGLTPFATALTFRNNKAAQAILERLPKAAEQCDNKGRNFLHTAIQKNDMESILFLMSIQVIIFIILFNHYYVTMYLNLYLSKFE